MSVDNDADQGTRPTPVQTTCLAYLGEMMRDLPKDEAAAEMLADYRQVFFAGAWAVMGMMLDARAHSRETGKQMLDAIRAELDEWEKETHPADFRPPVRPARPAPAGTPVHTCHWPGCTVPVEPRRWGCRMHWFALPKHLRDRIWQTYRPGQEVTKDPSDDYLEAAAAVQEWIRNRTPSGG